MASKKKPVAKREKAQKVERFQVGDKVQHINTGIIETVQLTNDMPEYKKRGYFFPDEGVVLETTAHPYGIWKVMSDYRKVVKVTKDAKLPTSRLLYDDQKLPEMKKEHWDKIWNEYAEAMRTLDKAPSDEEPPLAFTFFFGAFVGSYIVLLCQFLMH